MLRVAGNFNLPLDGRPTLYDVHIGYSSMGFNHSSCCCCFLFLQKKKEEEEVERSGKKKTAAAAVHAAAHLETRNIG